MPAPSSPSDSLSRFAPPSSGPLQLDPENVYAMSDLGEFYVAAPSLIGGGLDKAQALAAQNAVPFSRPVPPSARPRRRKEKGRRPRRDQSSGTQSPPEKHPRPTSTSATSTSATISLTRCSTLCSPAVDADRPQRTLHSGRRRQYPHRGASSPERAETLLRNYLASAAKTDEAPAFKVHVQLGGICLHSRGDSAGAHREYAAALSLASNYAPARKAMQGS